MAIPVLFSTRGFSNSCVPNGDPAEVVTAGFYVDIDQCQPACVMSVWIYKESNGLQRVDARFDGTCGGEVAPDTRIAFVYAAPAAL